MDTERIELLETKVELLQKMVDNQREQISLINEAGKLTNKRIDGVINIIRIMKGSRKKKN